MTHITLLFLGALLNRILGGGLDSLNQNHLLVKRLQKVGGTAIAMLGVCAVYLTISPYGTTQTLIISIFSTIGLYIGSTWGWGTYIGALGGWEKKKVAEVAVIDNIFSKYVFTQRIDGALRLAARGALWGACVAAGSILGGIICLLLGFGFSFSLWPVFAGALMPAFYYVCIEFSRIVFNNAGKGWPLAEWLFGAFFYYVCWISVM